MVPSNDKCWVLRAAIYARGDKVITALLGSLQEYMASDTAMPFHFGATWHHLDEFWSNSLHLTGASVFKTEAPLRWSEVKIPFWLHLAESNLS